MGKIDPLRDTAKLRYIRRPTRPVRLFSFSDRDILNRFSKTDEATKSLAMHLLSIVKSVNSQRKVKVENGTMVPNFYIMATKCETNEKEKVTEMDSTGIVNLVKDIIHMIKIGIYRKVEYVEVICDSPAIFLIKYIKVKHWDSVMNAVYVVTSEYLLPYLCKIRAAEEEEEKAEQRIIRNVVSAGTKRKRKQASLDAKKGKVEKPKLIKLENEANNSKISTKTDEEIVEGILSKYLEKEAVQFFMSQMKVGNKTYNQYRWKNEDKIFALNLLRKNPTEYCILFQKFTLPSDKTLEKFVHKIQNGKYVKLESE